MPISLKIANTQNQLCKFYKQIYVIVHVFNFDYIITGSSKKLSSMFNGEMCGLRFLNIHKLVLEGTAFIKCYAIVYMYLNAYEEVQIYFIFYCLFSS